MIVNDGYVFSKIFINELLYIGSDANYITLFLKSEKKVMIRFTLNNKLEQVDPNISIRIHRSYCVNINYADNIFPPELTIQATKIPIGKSYKE